MFVLRYLSDGTLDPSFGDDGVVRVSFGPDRDSGNAVAVQSNGRIVVAGICCSAGSGYRFALTRLHADGSADARFGDIIQDCDAALTLPGGPGTLTEISFMWNLMIVESRHRSPLILIGCGWQSTFDRFFNEFDGYISANQREIVQFAEDVKTAVNMLES